MKTTKRQHSEHGTRHVTPAGRSVMFDLFPEEEAIELEICSTLLCGLERKLRSAPQDADV
jgi:hypothetical protein